MTMNDITGGIRESAGVAPPERVSDRPAAIEFVERMGVQAQGDGLPRIAGRLMGLMVLEEGPLAFGELAKRLQVSRGSISTNARLLEGMGILERVALPGERGDYFQLADDPYRALIEGARDRAAKGERATRSARDALDGEVPAEVGERLDELARFYGALREGIAGISVALDERTPSGS